MGKTGKFYCHAEDVEPNMTVPFALDPGLTVRLLMRKRAKV